MSAYSEEVLNAKELATAVDEAAAAGKKVTAEQFSCDFTKENFAAKPDLSAPGADEAPEEEACDNCGRVDGAAQWPVGTVHGLPRYNEDPPCKTIRKLTQKVQQKPPVPLEETCPKCGKPLLLRNGQYGEFISCSGYPKCKYIKQELLDVKCPKDGGDIAVRKTKRGDFLRLRELSEVRLRLEPEAGKRDLSEVRQRVPSGGRPTTRAPTSSARTTRGTAEETEEKGAPEEVSTTPPCTYEKKIAGPAPVAERPDPEKTRPVVESVA